MVLTPGRRVDFFARALDETGEALRDVSFTWDVTRPTAGRMEEPGQFVASPQVGHYLDAIEVVATQRTAQGDIQAGAMVTVTVEPPETDLRLAFAQLVPRTVTLSPGQHIVFSASGLDENGEPIRVLATWEMVDPMAGSVNGSGLFTAGRDPGVYPRAVRVQLVQEGGDQTDTVEAYATVNIPGPLDRVEVRPSTVNVQPGRSIRLRVVGYDSDGIEISLLRLRWSVEDHGAGTIDTSGLFTAGPDPGRYEDAIKLTALEAEVR